MPKLRVLSNKAEKPRLIFVGDKGKKQKLISEFAKKNDMEFNVYSNTEWATLEEIEQYIQDEEVSKQIIDLPLGNNASSSLHFAADENVKRISQFKKLTIEKAAKRLKISRATLYRKLEQKRAKLAKKASPKKLKKVA